MPRLLELDLARAIADLLALDGWRHVKTDVVSDRSRGKGTGEQGMADSLFLRYNLWPIRTPPALDPSRVDCEAMWIEFKTPRGRVAEHQHAWREREQARGALALIAGIDFDASLEGFARFYARLGLQRRKLRIGGVKTASESDA